MIPPGADPEEWARAHLRASTGATVRYQDGSFTKVPTLVPAHNPDQSCHWLHDGRCEIHTNAPFGCAFFDCRMSKQYASNLSMNGISAVATDHNETGLYSRLWRMLWEAGLRAPDLEVKQAALDNCYAKLQREPMREQQRRRNKQQRQFRKQQRRRR